MESDLGALDVLLFVFITVFLGYRLYMVLGQKHDQQRKRKSHIVRKHEEEVAEKEAKTFDLIDEDDEDSPRENVITMAPIDPNEPLSVKRGVEYIQKYDPDFCEDTFLVGAKKAFKMIVSEYSSGTISKIKPFVSDMIYGAFQDKIRDRKKTGSFFNIEILKILSADLMKVEVVDKKVHLKIQFISEQIIQDQKGQKKEVEEIVDNWIFERALKSTSPVWILIKM